MKILKRINHLLSLWVVVIISSIALPLSYVNSFIYAQETVVQEIEPTTIQTSPETSNGITPGPQEPTGPENTSYTYNEETGLWENQYYTWNPVTKQTKPIEEQYYSYNPETNKWDTTQWVYAPESGSYKEQIHSVNSVEPKTSNNIIQLPTTNNLQNNNINSSNELTKNSLSNETPIKLLQNYDYGNAGPGSLSVKEYDNKNQGFFDGFFNAKISVKMTSDATTGDASVIQNTAAGSALSGDAYTSANILNLIQSAWGLNGLMPYLYTENIQSDYVGDIFLNPLLLAVDNTRNTDELYVNISEDIAIENDLELSASTGNTLIKSNTRAGDAVSGDATVVLNLMNMIQSSINTGQSFIGTLNIHGNFEGDVLLPENLISELIAANVPTTTINTSKSMDLNTDFNQGIFNTINASASSGDAEVSNNTTGGSARSGSANTNINVFNLTGSQVIADQALLVFVNVMGEWIGFITNAPAGSNAALLGGNVSSVYSNTQDSEFNIDNNSKIDNSIILSATTGNATVTNNTTAGDALSGDANVAANITNISNSSFSLANWFGLLFINVFGDWWGSFGTDTAYGNIIAAINNPDTTSSVNSKNTSSSNTASQASPLGAVFGNENVKVFAVNFENDSRGVPTIVSSAAVEENDSKSVAVLADSEGGNSNSTSATVTAKSASSSLNRNLFITASLLTALLLYLSRSRNQMQNT